MNEGRSNTILLTVIGIATLLVVLVGATFAFFTARLTNTGGDSVVTFQAAETGTVTFTGGSPITVQNIYPRGEKTADTNNDTVMGADGDAYVWASKGFTVAYTNQGANAYEYVLKLNYTNNFANDQIHYVFKQIDGSCTDNKQLSKQACDNVSGTWTAKGNDDNTQGVIARKTGYLPNQSGSAPIVLGVGSFPAKASNSDAVARVHYYGLTISYPNDDRNNQNYGTGENEATVLNHEQTVTAFISIEEVNATNRTQYSQYIGS